MCGRAEWSDGMEMRAAGARDCSSTQQVAVRSHVKVCGVWVIAVVPISKQHAGRDATGADSSLEAASGRAPTGK